MARRTHTAHSPSRLHCTALHCTIQPLVWHCCLLLANARQSIALLPSSSPPSSASHRFKICGKHMATPCTQRGRPEKKARDCQPQALPPLLWPQCCPNNMTSDTKEPHQPSGRSATCPCSCLLSGSGPVARSIMAVLRIMYSAHVELQLADSMRHGCALEALCIASSYLLSLSVFLSFSRTHTTGQTKLHRLPIPPGKQSETMSHRSVRRCSLCHCLCF